MYFKSNKQLNLTSDVYIHIPSFRIQRNYPGTATTVGQFITTSHADPSQNLNKLNPFFIMKALKSYSNKLKEINQLRTGSLHEIHLEQHSTRCQMSRCYTYPGCASEDEQFTRNYYIFWWMMNRFSDAMLNFIVGCTVIGRNPIWFRHRTSTQLSRSIHLETIPFSEYFLIHSEIDRNVHQDGFQTPRLNGQRHSILAFGESRIVAATSISTRHKFMRICALFPNAHSTHR